MKILIGALAAALLAPAAGLAKPAMAGMNMTATKRGEGVGMIKALDRKAATITIQHGAIPSVGWPAMTMTFRANPPALLSRATVGERVRFTVVTGPSAPQVTSLRP